MTKILDSFEQQKKVEIEELISSCRKSLEDQNWAIIEIVMDDYSLSEETNCTISFEASNSFSRRWSIEGNVSINHCNTEYKIQVYAKCSNWSRNQQTFHNDINDLFQALKLSTYSIKELKKEPKKPAPSREKSSIADEIEKLGELLEKKIITKSEFTLAKKKLIE